MERYAPEYPTGAGAAGRSAVKRKAADGSPARTLSQAHQATLLPDILAAASEPPLEPARAAMESDVAHYAMEPLFIPGVRDRI
jgi:hypothetical protein